MTEGATTVVDILARYPQGRESLIPVLQDLQERDGYLAQQAVGELASTTGISVNEIYGVATFYTQFRFEPPAEHTISVCQGTACHVRGSHQLLADFQDRLHIRAGQTTDDGKFGIERVACVGCCALAPVVVVDGEVRANMQQKNVKRLLKQLDK